ncbi:MAG: TIGR00341 family protein [Acidobacteria bacterium]|nr:TIGR00341 family protein [Acidobacteriota bacterium]
MTGQDTGKARSESRFSVRVEPFWLNPATIKGTLAITAGLTLLLAPDLSAFVLRVVIGGALVISGGSDLWFKARGRDEGKVRGVLEAVITIGAGVVFLIWPEVSVTILALIAGVYFVVRGLAVIGGSLRQRGQNEAWVIDISRGIFLVALGAITVLIPESVILGVVAAVAALAIVLGGIMLAYGIRAQSDDELIDVDAATVSQLLVDWIKARDVGDDRRDEIGEGLFFEQPARVAKLTAWWVMLLLSVAIATFGIMQDSTAVVIGAMLIAPLMTPILGSAAGIVNAWQARIVVSLGLVAAGVAASIALAFIIGQWVPIIVPLEVNSQVTSRISPNMVDMMIALAAGAAGAYANVDRRVSASIAGVAIAVALVPPLGVVGLTLQAGMFADSFGAFLLFLTNLVSIILAATAVFFLTGYAPFQRLKENRHEVAVLLRTVALAALVILVPLVFTAENVLSTTGRQDSAQAAVSQWLGDDSTLTAILVEVDGTEVDVFLTGSGELPSVPDLAESLTDAFGTPADVRVEHAPTQVVEYSEEEGLTEAAGSG